MAAGMLLSSIPVLTQPALAQPVQTPSMPEMKESVDYSLAFSSYIYLNSPNTSDNLVLLQNLRYSWSIRGRKGLCFSSLLIHNLGLQIFPDSLHRFSPDDDQLTLKTDLPLKGPISVNVSAVLSSRLFSDFTTLPSDSGAIRRMNGGFLTPFVGSLSAGLGWQMKPGSLSVGLSAIRFTLVGDKRVYAYQETAFGVPHDKSCLFEYGLSLQVNACLNPFKWLRWSCDIYLFNKYGDAVTGNLKNMFAIQFSRFIRLNVQSRIAYDERISRKPQLEHVVSLGFGFLR